MLNLDYLYNPDVAKTIFSKNRFSDKKLGFQIIKNGMILPHRADIIGKRNWGAGGIVDGNDNYISSSFVHHRSGESYTPSPESIQNRSETVVYLGMFFHVWGHVITDDICYLWFLKNEAYLREFKNCPLVYIPFTNFFEKNTKNFKRLLEILEVDFDRLQPITQPTRFEKIILPDRSFTGLFANEYRETIERVRNFALKNRTPTSRKKIYYFYGRYQFGERRLARYLDSKGYDIISPEKLTFDEQLNLLINCDSFASTLGSISHNSLFLRDDTETIFFPRAVNCFTGRQPICDQVHNLKINYLDSTLSIFANGVPRANCFIINENLKRFFGDKWNGYQEDDFKIFLQYVKTALGGGLGINPKINEYYGLILSDFMGQLKQREDLIKAYNMPPHWEEFRS